MNYMDVKVDVRDVDNGWRAPEVVREMACERWINALEKGNLKSIAGGEVDHQNEDGTWTLAWIVGTDEHYYCAIFKPDENVIVTVDKGPARKQGTQGAEDR